MSLLIGTAARTILNEASQLRKLQAMPMGSEIAELRNQTGLPADTTTHTVFFVSLYRELEG